MMARKICVVTATRAEYGLLFWLLKALQVTEGIELQLIATGTHLSNAHGRTIHQIESDGFKIDARIAMLLEDDSPQGVTKSMALATMGFADAYERLAPDVVVLLGDRYEMLAAAQSAMIARIPVAHIHGGEATEGLIDEAIRHSITKMSHLHFVAAEPFAQRVIQLGEAPERVWTVGATGLDNIARLSLLDKPSVESMLGMPLRQPSFLVTYHPVTLEAGDPGHAMHDLLTVLDGFNGSIVLTGVNADTGGSSMRAVADAFAAQRPGSVKLVESLGALRYLSVMAHVDVVVGNSSSGLLEAPAMGKPTLDIGNRQRGRLRAPSVIHCEASQAGIREGLRQALQPEHVQAAAGKITPYGSPGAAERIAQVLAKHPLQGLIIKRFHDLGGSRS
jgi:UDP-N-acetylglucosamine 2-epimerase (non-hydrolysing)